MKTLKPDIAVGKKLLDRCVKEKTMPAFRRQFLLLITLTVAGLLAAAEPGTAFPLKDGDVWVMAGDSITAQHLHSNYFEAFCYARYPKLKFAFRNSGVGGHTIPTTLARFDYDIAAWKPTVVSVELGMNDKGGTPTDKFLANMGTMVERIRSIKARPVILAASPVNNGETLAKLAGGNQRLHEYAIALKEFCKKENIPYADQFHALLDLWGQNKPRETLANSVATLKQRCPGRCAGRRRASAHVPRGPGEESRQARVDAGRPGPSRPARPADDGRRAAEGIGRRWLRQQPDDRRGRQARRSQGVQGGWHHSARRGAGVRPAGRAAAVPDPGRSPRGPAAVPDDLDLSQYTLKVTGLKANSVHAQDQRSSGGDAARQAA